MPKKSSNTKTKSKSNPEPTLADELSLLLKKDLEITKLALNKVKIIAPEKSYANYIAKDFLEMAISYFEDAHHFKENNDELRAVACVNYAHAWLDAGARLGIFDVDEDDRLFTLAE
jgi:hypothetical protein